MKRSKIPAGMNINSGGYLRFHRPKSVRDRYAHRLYAERQLGRPLRADEEVHHLCGNKLCWPPTDFHLAILDAPLHHAIEGGHKRWRRKKVDHKTK